MLIIKILFLFFFVPIFEGTQNPVDFWNPYGTVTVDHNSESELVFDTGLVNEVTSAFGLRFSFKPTGSLYILIITADSGKSLTVLSQANTLLVITPNDSTEMEPKGAATSTEFELWLYSSESVHLEFSGQNVDVLIDYRFYSYPSGKRNASGDVSTIRRIKNRIFN